MLLGKYICCMCDDVAHTIHECFARSLCLLATSVTVSIVLAANECEYEEFAKASPMGNHLANVASKH
jgi:hypothetical protein